MSTPEQSRAPIADGTDISLDPKELDGDETPTTSAAEQYRDDADALGGTGGKDAGGAG